MKRLILFGFGLIFVLGFLWACSYNTVENDPELKQGSGTLWLSGGLMYCRTQIRMESGDTLIPVNEEKVLLYKSGQRMKISYKELAKNESGCSIGKDCLIEIVKVTE